eukprot:scaffold22521_cov49-Phaeocystis_antarctica.AAC.2
MTADGLRQRVAHPATLGLAYRLPLLQARALSETPPMRRCRPSQRDVVRGAAADCSRSAAVAAAASRSLNE